MRSVVDGASGDSSRASVLGAIAIRLTQAEALGVEVRRGLAGGDAETIDAATARLETLIIELRLLQAEWSRLPATLGAATTSAELTAARRELDEAMTRLARSAAVHGGLLERLVGLSRRLLEALGQTDGETYLPSGRSRELPVDGLQLRQQV
jgi:hypothetical protein